LSIDGELSNSEPADKNDYIYSKSAGWHKFAKLLLDKTVSLFVLIILLPLLLIIAIAIKLDSKGPVIFRQKRNGLGNREFLIWKFRSMTVMENGCDVTQAGRNDIRVTRLGHFLRKTSLDELPQFVNVFFGDMSLVGPRPHPVALNNKFAPVIKNYNNRHDVKPGLTGWAQVNGYRGPTETVEQMRKRVEHDLDYIRHWSFWFDLRIIMLTPYYGLVSKNAF